MLLIDKGSLASGTLALDAFRRNLGSLRKKVIDKRLAYPNIDNFAAAPLTRENPNSHVCHLPAGWKRIVMSRPVEHEYRNTGRWPPLLPELDRNVVWRSDDASPKEMR